MVLFRHMGLAIIVLLMSACATTSGTSFRQAEELDTRSVPTFIDAADVDAYLIAQRKERAAIISNQEAAGWEPEDNVIIVTGSKIADDLPITNNQVAGVDEGGIVKATSDYLVILRRGRVHVVRHGDDTLESVSSIDAFPPDDPAPDDTWYDEMLLHKGMVIVIGYSYGEDGTEISRFNLSDDGALTYRDTHYLSSWDYYSSSNYASRLVDGTFYTYTPTPLETDWRETLPFLERRLPDGSRKRIGTTLKPSDMGMTAPLMIDPSPYADIMHGITACDVLSEQLTCETRTVLGERSSEYYFSAEAAYIWTGTGHNGQFGTQSKDWGETLYRIPFDRRANITAMSVQGAPIDQFSFHEDDETDSLFVMTVGNFVFDDGFGFGMQMWESEFAYGQGALLRIPLGQMGNGLTRLPPTLYRAMPEMRGGVENRFVGRHLMVGSGYWRDEQEPPELFIAPLDDPWIQRIELPHSVNRLDRLGDDGVAIGEGQGEALGFSAIEFDEDRKGGRLASSYMLPAAEEGENRSQAFYWRPKDGDPEAKDGLMALPVNKELEGYSSSYLGSSAAMFYLERKGGQLSPVGELGTVPDASEIEAAKEIDKLEDAGDCKASCTDWYGNARPIFIGDRIFALIGDQIVEGEMSDGAMREMRRINFARQD